MGKRSGYKDAVSGSQLAKMGTCERLMRYEHLCGMRRSEEQALAIERGNAAHQLFHAEAVRSLRGADSPLPGKPWCFVATMIYGPDDPATELLRRFRDAKLRPTIVGRALVRLYYQLSPRLCRLMLRHPLLLPPARLGLKAAVWFARTALRHMYRGRP